VRLGEDKRLCLLVIIGVREDGRKELLAVEDGYRESSVCRSSSESPSGHPWHRFSGCCRECPGSSPCRS
jgi:hypothetical protein